MNAIHRTRHVSAATMTACFAVVLAAAFMLTACSSDEGSDYTSTFTIDNYLIAESGEWTDGTYTAKGQGRNSVFDVTVTIENGVMTNIEVGSHEETEDKGALAIESLPDLMIEAQSPNVDAYSGATITSDGLRDAVATCLEEASA